MRDDERVVRAGDPALPGRRRLVPAARRVLWGHLREHMRKRLLERSLIRQRLADFLERCAAGRLLAILRSAALSGAVAAALFSPGAARAQGFPAIELAAIARGEGGFLARGEGKPASPVGRSVADAGDVNGDGIPDLIVAGKKCVYGNCTFATYVVFGRASGEAVELSEVQAGRGGFAIRGSAEGDISGYSVSGAGDVNGDGLSDLAIGGPGADPGGRIWAGESYVVFGKASGEAVELTEVQAGRGGFAIRGSAANDYSGSSVSGAGDVNGDGFADLVIGAHRADPGGRGSAGESYVVFGKPDGEAVEFSEIQAGRGGFAIRGSAERDYSGSIVSGAGDVNGDGLGGDLVIASRLGDARYPSLSGAVYVVFASGGAAPKPRFRRGAVQGEETLGMTDAIVLLGHLFLGEPAPPCLDAADADDSGVLDLTDAIRLLNHLFLGGEAPPDPGPASCGRDPTEDDLRCASPTSGCGI